MFFTTYDYIDDTGYPELVSPVPVNRSVQLRFWQRDNPSWSMAVGIVPPEGDTVSHPPGVDVANDEWFRLVLPAHYALHSTRGDSTTAPIASDTRVALIVTPVG